MISEVFFALIAITSLVALCTTMLNLVVFLSSLTVNALEEDTSPFMMFTTDICLVVMFMAQHSAMASPTYKRFMDNIGLEPITRAVYVFCSAFTLQFLMSVWQPIPEVSLWLLDTEDTPTFLLFCHALHAALWVILLLEVLVIEPLEFVGLKQVYNYIRDRYPSTFYIPQKMRQFIVHMPHAGVACFLTILWLHPCMTLDRVILATVWTAYLYCGCSVTEKGYQYIRNYASCATYTERSTRRYLRTAY